MSSLFNKNDLFLSIFDLLVVSVAAGKDEDHKSSAINKILYDELVSSGNKEELFTKARFFKGLKLLSGEKADYLKIIETKTGRNQQYKLNHSKQSRAVILKSIDEAQEALSKISTFLEKTKKYMEANDE